MFRYFTHQRLALSFALGCVLLFVVWLVFNRIEVTPQSKHAPGMQSVDQSEPVRVPRGSTNIEPKSPEHTNSAQQRLLQKRSVAISEGAYANYLESICPRLTPAEEDRLAAESGNDPIVLLGLALARSKRAEHWLRLAYQKAPEDPRILYAVLARNDPGYDRLTVAQTLARLTPDDAAPLHSAALAALTAGDRKSAFQYLSDATKRSGYSSVYRSALEATVAAFQLAGRPENSSRERVYLEGIYQYEMTALMKLAEKTGVVVGGAIRVSPDPALAALLLDAHQKALYSKGLDLETYASQRVQEIAYLNAFLMARMKSGNPNLIEQHLGAPASEMLASAKGEFEELEPLIMFNRDKPGIFQRLNSSDRKELVARIDRDGEIAAYSWVYTTRPDIFTSVEFKPQGYSQDGWDALVAQGFLKGRVYTSK